MKTPHIKRAVFALAVSAACLAAQSVEIVHDGVTYTVTDPAASPVRVRAGTEDSGRAVADPGEAFSVEIPAEFTENGARYRVTGIGTAAFMDLTNLKSVSIPDSVLYINSSAFRNTGLVSVTVPGLNDPINSDYIFAGCDDLEGVTLGEGIRTIGRYAFLYCGRLKRLNLPESLTRIRDTAFRGAGIEDLALPANVATLEYGAFYQCHSLTNLVLNPRLRTINADKLGAFASCTKLARVEIPDSVTYISGSAFSGCANISSVKVPALVLQTGVAGVFSAAAEKIEEIEVSSSATVVTSQSFAGCVNVRRIALPDSVTEIAADAFEGLAALEDVTIPPEATGLTSATFSGCDRLWSKWYRAMSDSAYDLSATPGDRKIAHVALAGDAALDGFVLKDGKVYDSVIVVENLTAGTVTLTLPPGCRYLTQAGKKPLAIPPSSLNLLTVTRVTDDTFLVTRQKLQTIE